jgi:two-component system, LuxR family, response regulator FixJ
MAITRFDTRAPAQGPTNEEGISEHAVVHVVDDDSDVRESLAELLQSIGMSVLTYASAEEFLEFYNPSAPGCLLVDVCMPGMSGLELQRQLAARQWHIPWIVITAHANISMAVEAMSDGACGFLEKPYRSHELLRLIKKAVARERTTRKDKQRRRELIARFGLLSPRERQVMELVTEGVSNKQIARQLGISERTVEVHRAKVMKKLSAATLVELINLAAEHRALQESLDLDG